MVNTTTEKTDIDVIAAVFERLPHGVSVVHLDDENDLGSFRFIEANPAASHHSDVDHDNLIGTTIRESFPELLQTDWPQKYLESIRTGEPVLIGDVEYPDRAASQAHFTITIVPLGGKYVAILFANTSKRHGLEGELVKKAAETARLSMLHETALAMAHHIRNALTPLGLIAEFYDGHDPETGNQLKKMAAEQGDRIAAIIDALVEMSQSGNDSTKSYIPSKETLMLDMDKLIEKHLERRTKLMKTRRSGRLGPSGPKD